MANRYQIPSFKFLWQELARPFWRPPNSRSAMPIDSQGSGLEWLVCECVHEWVNVSQHCKARWIKALYVYMRTSYKSLLSSNPKQKDQAWRRVESGSRRHNAGTP